MKDKKTIIISALTILLLITFITVMIIIPKNKVYKDNGFTIKLPSTFVLKESPSLSTYLYSKDIKIGVQKEEIKKIEDEVITEKSTLQEYASRIAKLNKFNVSNLYKVEKTDYLYYSYYKNDFIYIALFAKTDDCFYTVYFAQDEDYKDELFENFKDWSKTIKFD